MKVAFFAAALIGITNALCGAGSFFPLAWKALIENDLISYSEIMWTWFCLSMTSLGFGTLIYPWNNLPQDLTKGRVLNVQARKFSELRTKILKS